ncbi:hypothetical protein B0H14DRAFT_1322534 [Mycena olivaceomarginata]|nr:hypothetical protein B0H14DRAFT_1322534 [Mycena olivaceomarginata]
MIINSASINSSTPVAGDADSEGVVLALVFLILIYIVACQVLVVIKHITGFSLQRSLQPRSNKHRWRCSAHFLSPARASDRLGDRKFRYSRYTLSPESQAVPGGAVVTRCRSPASRRGWSLPATGFLQRHGPLHSQSQSSLPGSLGGFDCDHGVEPRPRGHWSCSCFRGGKDCSAAPSVFPSYRGSRMSPSCPYILIGIRPIRHLALVSLYPSTIIRTTRPPRPFSD